MKVLFPVSLFALGTFFLAGCGNTQIKVQDAEAKYPTIMVQGVGELSVVPDQAGLNVTLLARADTAEQASGRVNEDATAMIAALKEAGLEEADIQTGYVNVQPEYEARQVVVVHSLADKPKPRAIVAYNARYTLEVTLHPLDKVKEISNLIRKQKGFSNLNGPNLSIANPEQYQMEAMDLAYANALAQAESLAQKAGLKIKGAKTINMIGGAMPRPMRASLSMERADAAQMPLEPGEQKVSSAVQVVFECRRGKENKEE